MATKQPAIEPASIKTSSGQLRAVSRPALVLARLLALTLALAALPAGTDPAAPAPAFTNQGVAS